MASGRTVGCAAVLHMPSTTDSYLPSIMICRLSERCCSRHAQSNISLRSNNVNPGNGVTRLAVTQALHGLAADIDVQCSNPGLGGSHEPFQTMLNKMEHSQFCLALPGDSPSTRRLSEIFMAGRCWIQHIPATLHS